MFQASSRVAQRLVQGLVVAGVVLILGSSLLAYIIDVRVTGAYSGADGTGTDITATAVSDGGKLVTLPQGGSAVFSVFADLGSVNVPGMMGMSGWQISLRSGDGTATGAGAERYNTTLGAPAGTTGSLWPSPSPTSSVGNFTVPTLDTTAYDGGTWWNAKAGPTGHKGLVQTYDSQAGGTYDYPPNYLSSSNDSVRSLSSVDGPDAPGDTDLDLVSPGVVSNNALPANPLGTTTNGSGTSNYNVVGIGMNGNGNNGHYIVAVNGNQGNDVHLYDDLFNTLSGLSGRPGNWQVQVNTYFYGTLGGFGGAAVSALSGTNNCDAVPQILNVLTGAAGEIGAPVTVQVVPNGGSLPPVPPLPDTGVAWLHAGDSTWNTGSNWGSSPLPNSAGAVALLGTNGGNPGVRIDLGADNVSLGYLSLDNTRGAYTVLASAGGSLTFQSTFGHANVYVFNPGHQIAAPITLAGDTDITLYNNASLALTGPLALSAPASMFISGTGDFSLVLASPGTVPAALWTTNWGTTTLGSSVAGTTTFAHRVDVEYDLTIPTAPGGTVVFADLLNVLGTITKQGPGTVYMTGVAAGAGALIIQDGTLSVTHQVIGGIVQNNGSLIIEGADDGPDYFTAPITGTGSLTKTGLGTLYLINPHNNYTGGTTISQGVLSTQILSGRYVNNGGLTTGGPDKDFSRVFDTSSQQTISGSGWFAVQGGGLLVLNGACTYTGTTLIDGKTLRLGGHDRLPTATALTLTNAPGSILQLNSFNQTLGSLSGGGTRGGNIALGTGTLTVGDASNTTYAGIICGSGGLIKVGSGTLALAGISTYTGTTEVRMGTLEIDGGLAGLGLVHVLAGATLSGSGTVAGTILGDPGSIITARSGLVVGTTTTDGGFATAGQIDVGHNTVAFLATATAPLGSQTTLGDAQGPGTITLTTLTPGAGFVLDTGNTVVGHGLVDGEFQNEGGVAGDGTSSGERLVFPTGHTVWGHGTFTNTLIEGTFAPGDSPAIVHGTNEAFSGTIEFQLGGITAGAANDNHDQIVDSGEVDLTGSPTLSILPWDNYVPQAGDQFVVMEWSTGLSGAFASVDVDPWFTDHGISFALSYNNAGGPGNLTLQAVPEPATLALLALGALAIVRRPKRRADQ